jgi:hypothetical protein
VYWYPVARLYRFEFLIVLPDKETAIQFINNHDNLYGARAVIHSYPDETKCYIRKRCRTIEALDLNDYFADVIPQDYNGQYMGHRKIILKGICDNDE